MFSIQEITAVNERNKTGIGKVKKGLSDNTNINLNFVNKQESQRCKTADMQASSLCAINEVEPVVSNKLKNRRTSCLWTPMDFIREEDAESSDLLRASETTKVNSDQDIEGHVESMNHEDVGTYLDDQVNNELIHGIAQLEAGPSDTKNKKKRRRSSAFELTAANIITVQEQEEDTSDLSTSQTNRRSHRLKRKSLALYKDLKQESDTDNKRSRSSVVCEDAGRNEEDGVPLALQASSDDSSQEIPDWLIQLYRNKNYTEPQAKPMETIFEHKEERPTQKMFSRKSEVRQIDFEDEKRQVRRFRRRQLKARRRGFQGLIESEELSDQRLHSKLNEMEIDSD